MTNHTNENKAIFSNLDKEYFMKLSNDHKIIWFSRLGYYLSMKIRIAIYDSRDSLIKTDDYRIDIINDILLQIFGKIGSKIRNNDNFSDTEFFDMLEEKAKKIGFNSSVFVEDVEYMIKLTKKMDNI
ncbi:hypothetical protein KTI96_19980 [Acinetobacter bereziniae]|uniref:hypothetical protein n=1 Tax=Acinetobacter bereziniae TaxID=106648 RepID=UPI0021CD7807|nr:hypothetical protein [Acinetobacter bereziniae]MCU4539409.1 hypothetical protein [Acinetobacter bereziniae]